MLSKLFVFIVYYSGINLELELEEEFRESKSIKLNTEEDFKEENDDIDSKFESNNKWNNILYNIEFQSNLFKSQKKVQIPKFSSSRIQVKNKNLSRSFKKISNKMLISEENSMNKDSDHENSLNLKELMMKTKIEKSTLTLSNLR